MELRLFPPNIYQDNFLTGSTPFVVYPRLVSSANFPIPYGFQITPAQLPRVYTPTGQDIFASGNPKAVPPNTVMDVERYEQDVAALTPSNVVSALALEHSRPIVQQCQLVYMDGRTGAEDRQSYRRRELCWNGCGPFAAHKLSECLSRALIRRLRAIRSSTVRARSLAASAWKMSSPRPRIPTYHALQTSLSGDVGHGGPGIQASYTWSKSIDDTSQVIGSGSTGAVSQAFPQDPFDTRLEKGPSSFRCDARVRP